jgi:hypothetical protein
MNKNKWILSLGVLGMLTMGLQCKKDPPLDPDAGLTELEKLDKYVPITSEGKYTFGCLVNGKLWLPEVKCSSVFNCDPEVFGDYGYSSKNILVQGRYKVPNDGINETIYFEINGYEFLNDTIILSSHEDSMKNFGAYFMYLPNQKGYYTDSINKGSVIISRLDTINGIVSGEFSFEGVSKSGEKVSITEGRFDVTFP